MRTLPVLAVIAAAALLLGGCAGDPAATSTSAPATSSAPSGSISVSAAASLKSAFDDAIAAFTRAHPGVTIRPDYDGSSTLATQIIGGAPVDVFASADQANMAKVTDAGLAQDAVLFASNTLVIVVPAGNPARIRTLQDLARPSVKVVLCAPAVPCGAASRKLLADAGVKVTPVSSEQNVTAVLTKIRNDEADAGLVYVTDAKTTGQVQAIAPAGAADVVNHYPIAVLDHAPNPALARAFVAFVTSPAGQRILATYGFAKP